MALKLVLMELKLVSFSAETTSMKGKEKHFLLAAQSTRLILMMVGDDMFNYHYKVDLNTSFTGDDKLNVEFARW